MDEMGWESWGRACLVGSLSSVSLGFVSDGVGGPEGQVVPEELHDEGGVLVRVLVQSVELSDGVIERLQETTLHSIHLSPSLNFNLPNLSTCLANWHALSGLMATS